MHVEIERRPKRRTITTAPLPGCPGPRRPSGEALAERSERRWAELLADAEMARFEDASKPTDTVLSPRNTDAEIPEKTALYFDAGAREVWICAESGGMSFLARHRSAPMSASESFPEFPSRITLR